MIIYQATLFAYFLLVFSYSLSFYLFTHYLYLSYLYILFYFITVIIILLILLPYHNYLPAINGHLENIHTDFSYSIYRNLIKKLFRLGDYNLGLKVGKNNQTLNFFYLHNEIDYCVWRGGEKIVYIYINIYVCVCVRKN